jgi:hypothetical protein
VAGSSVAGGRVSIPEFVPPELRAAHRWVAWRPLDDKKPPVGDDGRALQEWNAPEKLLSYEAAVARAARLADGGVGFVLGDGISGIDMDDCLDPATHQLHPVADDILFGTAVGCYAEVSPSGTGVKVFGRSHLPPVELKFNGDGTPTFATDARPPYFTVTGDCVNTEVLGDVTKVIDFWSAQRRAARSTKAPDGVVGQGEQHDALIREAGSLRRRGHDDEATFAMLRGWVDARFDPRPSDKAIREIVRSTRPWQEEPRTAESLGLDAEWLTDATLVAAEGRDIAEQGVPYVLGGIVPAIGTLGMLVAYTKVGKTTLGQALGAAVSSGVPFLGRNTTKARVLYIAAEDPPEYTAWVARHLVAEPGAMTFYRRGVVLNDLGLAAIAETVKAGGYGLVLIASWQAVIRGEVDDENDNAGAVMVVERVKAATRTLGVPWLIDAHAGKGEDQEDEADPTRALRGASAAAGAADYILSLRYADGAFGSLRRLSGKGRFVSLEPQTIRYDPTTGVYESLGATKNAVASETWKLIVKTRALTSEPRTVDVIAKAAGLVSASGNVTGDARRKVRDALREREGVTRTEEKRRGQRTILYSLLVQQMELEAGS